MKKTKKIKTAKKERDFGKLFLENFVKSLILNTKPKEILTMPGEETREEKAAVKEIYGVPTEFKPPKIPQLQEIPTTKMLVIRPITQIQHPRMAPMPKPVPQPIPPIQRSQISFAPFRKISPLLQDSSILSIECPGPEKNLIINKYGVIQTLPLTLSQEEINIIIEDISERTRIPLIQGVFKAALGSLIVTAVISEFVGTRFIIEKRRLMPMPY